MKQVVLIFVIMLMQFCVNSQNYFIKVFGDVNSERFFNSEKTNDNNFIVLGRWKNLESCSNGGYDYKNDLYIIKIDTNGTLINQLTVISDEDKQMVYIKEVNSDEYYLLGSLGDICDYRYFGYIKINSSGNIIEKEIFEGNFIGYCKDATKLSNDDYIMVGEDLVLKVTFQGDTIASKKINIPEDYSMLKLNKVVKNPETNDFIITGNLVHPTPEDYRYDFMVISMDDELNINWSYIFNISEFDFIYGVNYTIDNNILLTGSTVDTVISDLAYSKAFIWKMTEDGDSLWYKDYSGMDSIVLCSVSEIPETKDIIATGLYNFISGYSLRDGYFMRVDSSGYLINDNTIGGEAHDQIQKQLVIDSSNIYLFGISESYYANGLDILVVKTNANGYVDSTTSLPEISNLNLINLYPNPFNNELNISCLNNLKIDNINIFNIYGQIVYSVNNIKSSNYTLKNSRLISGIYYYKIKLSDRISYSGKIIKQ